MFFGLPSKDGAGVRNRLFVDHVVEWGWGMGGGNGEQSTIDSYRGQREWHTGGKRR